MTQAPPSFSRRAELFRSQQDPESLPFPLRFCAPEGWPPPGSWWLAAHQGWTPPREWVPLAGLEPAPDGWTWWERDPAGWSVMTASTSAQRRHSIIACGAFFALAVILLEAPFLAHSGLRILLWGALIFGPVEITRNAISMATAHSSFHVHLRRQAEHLRSSPTELAFRLDHDDVVALFFFGPSNRLNRGRILILVLSGISAAALVMLVANAFVEGSLGSGAH